MAIWGAALLHNVMIEQMCYSCRIWLWFFWGVFCNEYVDVKFGMCFCHNRHQVLSNSKDWNSNSWNVLGARQLSVIYRKAKMVQGHICLREKNEKRYTLLIDSIISLSIMKGYSEVMWQIRFIFIVQVVNHCYGTIYSAFYLLELSPSSQDNIISGSRCFFETTRCVTFVKQLKYFLFGIQVWVRKCNGIYPELYFLW